MPSHVRMFWWITCAIIAYWIAADAWQIAFPADDLYVTHNHSLARLITNRILHGLIVIFIWGIPLLGFAWLAAFRRLNFARWAYVIIFLIHVGFLVGFVVYKGVSTNLLIADTEGMVIYAFMLSAIILVFTGDARLWFKLQSAVG